MNRLLLVLVAAVFASGCIRNPIAMMPSTKPLAPGSFQELGPVEETDCLWYLFSIIPVTTGNNMQGAMADAIKKSGGDALVQVTAETYYQNFIVISRYCTIIQGVAVKSQPSMLPPR
jgi:hypothetical protein